jgi:hypothetical protein
MKKTILAALVMMSLISLMGFTPAKSNKTHATLKKSGKGFGWGWIASNHDGFQACPYQTYTAMDVEEGATISWYVDFYNWYVPIQYVGSSPTIGLDLEPGDVLYLVVNEGTPEEYEYWDTATPCE